MSDLIPGSPRPFADVRSELEACATHNDFLSDKAVEGEHVSSYFLGLSGKFRRRAEACREAIEHVDALSQRVVDITTELHISEYERAELLKEVVRLRTPLVRTVTELSPTQLVALGRLADCRDCASKNHKAVSIDVEILDAVLGRVTT